MLSQQIIEKELLRIQRKYGTLTPPLIVQESRPQGAALHKHFVWNDTKAGKAYREWQARQIIAVVTFQHPEMDAPVRTFQNVTLERPGEDGTAESYHVYMRTVDILKNPEARHQLLERAHREASEWAHRYKSLVELAEIVSVIQKVTSKGKGK
jgi:hypothetical protein